MERYFENEALLTIDLEFATEDESQMKTRR
jgi:hypothetical protein